MKIKNCKMYMPVKIKGTNELGYIYDVNDNGKIIIMTNNKLKKVKPSNLRKYDEWIKPDELKPPASQIVLLLIITDTGTFNLADGYWDNAQRCFYSFNLYPEEGINPSYKLIGDCIDRIYWKEIPEMENVKGDLDN